MLRTRTVVQCVLLASLFGGVAMAQTGTGVVYINYDGTHNNYLGGLALSPTNEDIVIGGYISMPSAKFLAARLLPTGHLDPSFAGGMVITDVTPNLSNGANDCVVQPDGKIILAGSCETKKKGSMQVDSALVRYNTNGTLDSTFGSGGKVITDMGTVYPYGDEIGAVALQPDGKILTVGYADNVLNGYLTPQLAMARYTARGQLDTTFGNNGKVVTFLNSQGTTQGIDAVAVALQWNANGTYNIIVGARTPAPASMAVLRYSSSGKLDTTFGQGGSVTFFPPGYYGCEMSDLAVDALGNIVVTAWTNVKPPLDAIVARFTRDGVLDTSFGGGLGFTALDLGDTDTKDPYGAFYAVAIQSDGKVVAAGFEGTYDETGNPGPALSLLARFDLNGTLDTTFGGGTGYVETLIGSGIGFNRLVIQPDGKLVAASTHTGPNGSVTGIYVARFLTDGTLDQSFGSP